MTQKYSEEQREGLLELMHKSSEKDPSGKGQHEAGAKLDDGKVLANDIMRMFSHALWEVCSLGTKGAIKYSLGGFLEVDNGEARYGNAEMRHKFKEWMGEEMDTDTEELHATAEAWNALARLEFIMIRKAKEKTTRVSQKGFGHPPESSG